MSGVTQSSIPVRQRLARVDRRARIVALCAITAVSAVLVVLMLAVSNDSSSTGADEPAAAARTAGRREP